VPACYYAGVSAFDPKQTLAGEHQGGPQILVEIPREEAHRPQVISDATKSGLETMLRYERKKDTKAVGAKHMSLRGALTPMVVGVSLGLTGPCLASDVELVSTSSAGVQGNDFSVRPEISCDGSRIAFVSMARNLDEAHPNPANLNIYLRERSKGSTWLVSVGPGGVVDGGTSVDPAISGTGRFVAFSSTSGTLVDGLHPRGKQIYLFDAATAEIVMVSMGMDGLPGNGESGYPSISADGQVVAFASKASNLVPGDKNGYSDVFAYDVVSKTLRRVSVSSESAEGVGDSDQASVSGDGKWVGFRSSASNLVNGDVNHVDDVFVYDLSNAKTQLVSFGGAGNVQGDGDSSEPSLSSDGQLIAFSSAATNFATDRNGMNDIYVHDLKANITILASRTRYGSAANSFSAQPRISADGTHVAFLSAASDLVPKDQNARRDIFVSEFRTGKIQRINTGPEGEEANGNSFQPAISCEGTVVAFRSGSGNLIKKDSNFTDDVFVRVVSSKRSAAEK
jgi:Tol biopolymer transport system component